MKIGADTSFVIRLLTGEPAPLAELALKLMKEVQARGGVVAVSDLVLAESYYALHYHYLAPKAEALARLKDFVLSDGIECTGSAKSILSLKGLSALSPGFIDRMIIDHYFTTGADEVVTFEKAAKKISRVRIIM
jgi:predicted nucleic-acid-binding protein